MADADLGAILDQTRALRSAAEEDDWERVARVEAGRRLAIEAFFRDNPPGAQPALREAIAEIQASDRLVMRLAQARRDRLRAELERIGQGRNAVRAYRAHQAP